MSNTVTSGRVDKNVRRKILDEYSTICLRTQSKLPEYTEADWRYKYGIKTNGRGLQRVAKGFGPFSNIGIICGPGTKDGKGLMVVDIDAPEIFIPVLNEMQPTWLDDMLIIQSGKGFHLYFNWDQALYDMAKKEDINETLNKYGVELLLGKNVTGPSSIVKQQDGSLKEYRFLTDKPRGNIPEWLRELFVTVWSEKRKDTSFDPNTVTEEDAWRYADVPLEVLMRTHRRKWSDVRGNRTVTAHRFGFILGCHGHGQEILEDVVTEYCVATDKDPRIVLTQIHNGINQGIEAREAGIRSIIESTFE